MDNTREKLIELMTEFYGVDPMYYGVEAHHLADFLIANGVTVQDSKVVEIDQFNKWISVKNRLPSVKKMIDGEEYYKTVAVRIEGYEVEKIAYYDDEEKQWFDTDDFPIFEKVTHWYELPEWDLLQPPKGE